MQFEKIEYSDDNFEKMVKGIKDKIEENFLIDKEKFARSRRNIYVNPWITPGIIASINQKQVYYKQWKKSVRKVNKLGDYKLYSIYREFRKKLKVVIKQAKKNITVRSSQRYRATWKKHGLLSMN